MSIEWNGLKTEKEIKGKRWYLQNISLLKRVSIILHATWKHLSLGRNSRLKGFMFCGFSFGTFWKQYKVLGNSKRLGIEGESLGKCVKWKHYKVVIRSQIRAVNQNKEAGNTKKAERWKKLVLEMTALRL